MTLKPQKLFRINSRGQAALVDSLFFIAIISVVCTGLFYFAINYGTSTESQLNSFYSSDFAMDTLKVITYINLYRDGTAVNPSDSLTILDARSDYLLAMIKEDYAKNHKITIPTQTAIANTLHSVLKPFDSSIDYIFYIAKEGATVGENRYVTLLLSTRKCTDIDTGNSCNNATDQNKRDIKRVYYSCNPTSGNVIEKYIFPYSGKVDSATGKISLVDATGTYTYYSTGMYLWVAKKMSALDAIVNSNPASPSEVEANFDCNILPTT